MSRDAKSKMEAMVGSFNFGLSVHKCYLEEEARGLPLSEQCLG